MVELSVYYTLRFLIGIQGISEVDTGNNSIYLDKEVIIVYDLIFMHANNTASSTILNLDVVCYDVET